MTQAIRDWTVRYSPDGPASQISVPHSWRQDMPITFEGPAFYATHVEVPKNDCWLRFYGVSFEAKVSINGAQVLAHRGIWDAFEVDLRPYQGTGIEVEVRVVKNGGATFPVREVASGFLPYVFGTFGGIYGNVEIIDSLARPPTPPTRVSVTGGKISIDGKPFYPRGLLTWGWYPEIGHTNPAEETIRREVLAARVLGFNLIKFCLWIPSHRYLEILREEGMEAWIELPLWDPTDDPDKQADIALELQRIVQQYAHHDNVIAWTAGCELSGSTSPAYREQLVSMIQELTGCALVKDNSGSAEMYGGDLREFGTFDDFHPYCDTQYYGPVLDTLLPGPRERRPILLGEFNDFDVARDLARLAEERPFWSSEDPDLNDVGVRWQHDLPGILASGAFPQNLESLIESSRRKALFVRKQVHEMVRSRSEISGYVVTGIRDTPISSSGFFDDWDRPRLSADECAAWNGPSVLFRIPVRRPPWVAGGNRPGYLDPANFFAGNLFWRIGIHSEAELHGRLEWQLLDAAGSVAASGFGSELAVAALDSREIAQIAVDGVGEGGYRLQVAFGASRNEWQIWVVEPMVAIEGWRIEDPGGRLGSMIAGGPNLLTTQTSLVEGKTILFLENEGTLPCPFWRENIARFHSPEFWQRVRFAEEWDRLLPLSTDRAIEPNWLSSRGWGPVEILMERIDTRTFARHIYLAKAGDVLVTSLRPEGGLGSSPANLATNPAGVELIRSLASTYED
jgi:hypothetical protein